MELIITHAAALVLGILIGLWGRKKWGKDSPATLAAADAAAKQAGEELKRRF